MSYLQPPIFYESPIIHQDNSYSRIRETKLDFDPESKNAEQFVYSEILKLLPRSYVEDFQRYKSHSQSSILPKRPSIIFTANNYDTDDYFKIWSSEKAKFGSKIVIWQHGNNIGTARHGHYPEIRYSDKFVTWGLNVSENSHQGFCQKTPHPLMTNSKRGQRLLLIQDQFPTNWTLRDNANRFKYYVQDQHTFVKSLSVEPMKALTVRRFGPDRSNSNANDHWRDLETHIDQKITHDDGRGSSIGIIKKSKLAVFSYYSTGFLECLAMNHPTIAFWSEGYDIFSDNTIKHFIPLLSSGLIHFSAESAANHINLYWSDVFSWWTKPEVVAARQLFVEIHVRQSRMPIREFRTILKSLDS
jgi:putative transferase (TIGR04331 family)